MLQSTFAIISLIATISATLDLTDVMLFRIQSFYTVYFISLVLICEMYIRMLQFTHFTFLTRIKSNSEDIINKIIYLLLIHRSY